MNSNIDNKSYKTSLGSGVGSTSSAPNKMRLYATWVDRTPSNCIPRLCSLTLTRLQILKPLGSDIAIISIAVKMQSSKRTLRSNEITMPSNGLLDTQLDITLCLQYPHFLKRDGNKLHILLQRRKRYKNRTMLGFKTLAEGVIRMDQILQKPTDLELELASESGSSGGGKDKVMVPCARLYIVQMNSTPVDQQEPKVYREPDFSDDDDEISSGEEEPGDLSDTEAIRTKNPHTRHNLKQRIVSLLRRFRVSDSGNGRGNDLDIPRDIQALFHELGSLSCDEESGAEQDTMSISSTPKPSLRPFFSSSKSLLDTNPLHSIESDKIGEERATSGSDGNADIGFADSDIPSDLQTGSPPKDPSATVKKQSESDFSNIMQELSERKSKLLFRTSGSSLAKKKNSLSVSSDVVPLPEVTARKRFLEQITKLLPSEENILPECVVLTWGPENVCQTICDSLAPFPSFKTFLPISGVEVRALLVALFSKIHKYCNNCAKPSTTPVKIVLIGSDTLIGWFVRPFVEILSTKSPEWLSFIRIFIIPLGPCSISCHLANMDSGYKSLFPMDIDPNGGEIVKKLIRYTSVPPSVRLAQMPICEAMLTCYDETSQLFIPFINEVRVGPAPDHALSSSFTEADDMCTSPPAPSLTPPSSPNVQMRESPWEPIELQVDYWQMPKFTDISTTKTEKDRTKQDGKNSIKGIFRGLQAMPGYSSGLYLNVQMASKEKKQKIMRLGKKKEKEKDAEPRSQNIESVSRLICSARASHNNAAMRVYIDGIEYARVKFFQLSSTWQTHVKNLPVSLVGDDTGNQ